MITRFNLARILTVALISISLNSFAVVSHAAISSGVVTQQSPRLDATVNAQGLKTLRYGNDNFLANGEFQVFGATFARRDNSIYGGDVAAHTTAFDAATNTIIKTFTWGEVRCRYLFERQRLTFLIKVSNKSKDTLRNIAIQLAEIRFPRAPVGWQPHYPYIDFNVDEPSITLADVGTSVLAVVNEDVAKPLLTGFAGRESLAARPLWVATSNMNYLSPYMDNRMTRVTKSNATDSFRVSLRFAHRGTSRREIASDVLQQFANAYPLQNLWRDRRPIGALFLSSTAARTANNPRGWFNDANADFITTDSSSAASFRQRLMRYADDAIRIARGMNAQGVVVWDIEGQEHHHPISYIGDPRLLSPEMEKVVDEFFAKFRRANLRVGVCLRPQKFIRQGSSVNQIETANPATTLIEKISYAKTRWGCTLFYVDSNGDPNAPFDASVFRTVAARHADVLLIPEHERSRYYAYTAPYHSLAHSQIASTPDAVRELYPQGFSVIYAAESDTEKHRAQLIEAVKRGDILMYHGWYDNPHNEAIKSIYAQAKTSLNPKAGNVKD